MWWHYYNSFPIHGVTKQKDTERSNTNKQDGRMVVASLGKVMEKETTEEEGVYTPVSTTLKRVS